MAYIASAASFDYRMPIYMYGLLLLIIHVILTTPDSMIIRLILSTVMVRFTFDPAYCMHGVSLNILPIRLSTCNHMNPF